MTTEGRILSMRRQIQLCQPTRTEKRILLEHSGHVENATNAMLANSMLQSLVPDHFRGRLMSVYSLISVGLGQVLGAFAGGAVASAIGVDWAIGGGAAIMLMYAMYAFRRESSWIVEEH